MILQIDATVTGPDGVSTGSVAVTVVTPAARQESRPEPPAPSRADLENLRMRQRSQALRWGANRA